MLKHIVFWKFKDKAGDKTKSEIMTEVKSRLLSLKPIIPQIKSMQIGEDVLHSDMSYDMALVMDFETSEDLEIYKNHPEHVLISKFVATVREARACVDYNY